MAVECVTDSIWKTLLQVGIPSLITVVSIYFNYRTNKVSKQKDETIAQLNIDAKFRGEVDQRRARLIEDIAEKILSLESALGKHSGVFRRMPEGHNIPERSQDRTAITEAVDEVRVAVDECVGIRTKVNLLGQKKVSAEYQLLLESLFSFQKLVAPERYADRFEVGDMYAHRVQPKLVAVTQQLSDLYLQQGTTAERE